MTRLLGKGGDRSLPVVGRIDWYRDYAFLEADAQSLCHLEFCSKYGSV